MSKLLKVGDTVIYKGGTAKVISMDYCPDGAVYGEAIESIPWECVLDVTVDLDNGKWAKGYKIERYED